jgi:hypothetical protein
MFFQALRRFRRMCSEPYVPKVAPNAANGHPPAAVDLPAAKYTSPFGYEDRPQTSTRAKSRTNPRTPCVQSAPNLKNSKRPASKRRKHPPPTASSNRDEATSTTSSFNLFLSLPNTPDTEDPYRMLRTNHMVPQMPGLGTESYI